MTVFLTPVLYCVDVVESNKYLKGIEKQNKKKSRLCMASSILITLLHSLLHSGKERELLEELASLNPATSSRYQARPKVQQPGQ